MSEDSISTEVPPPEDGGGIIPSWVRDDKASQEVKNWADEPVLRGQIQRNKVLHLKIYGGIVALAMITFSLLYIYALCAWAFHYLAPEEWAFLTEHQLTKIQSMLFSGSVGAIVSSVMLKNMSQP